MATSLFKINTTDVSDNIVQNTYQVNRLPVYKTYEDANGATHRRFIRDKVRGKFQMFFKYMEDYEIFKALIDDNMSSVNFSIPCTLYDNLTGDSYTINAFIDYSPTLMMDAGRREYLKVLDITIEER